MSSRKRPLIGRILVEKGFVTPAQLEEGLRAQKVQEGKIGEILVRLKFLNEEAVLEALSYQWQIPYIRTVPVSGIDPELIEKVPISFAKRHEFLPFNREGNVVQVATSKPLNLSALDDLRLLMKEPIQVIAAPSLVVIGSINQAYERTTDSAEQAISDLDGESLTVLAEELAEPEDLLDASDEAPMIRLVNSILFQAVQQRASDIHFEPFEREVMIRYRIDGVLYNILTPPKRLQSSLLSRVKIMAGMDIAEKRLPQDGRIGLKIGGREIDIRVSDVPTAHGERLVLRLLDKSSIVLSLEDIGLEREGLAKLERLLRLSHGILLVTGPTGSGKTTTLYAGLNRVNSIEKNIITIEDPIEYQLKGIGQIQVNPKIELTFASGLRSILRQDPDIIMVGEIRDTETAEIAIQASLTGHLVLSTLHTNDSAGAITRLLDMGVEPFLVSSSVVALIAQRLVRLICSSCRVSYSPSAEELDKLGISEDGTERLFYRGEGCTQCMKTGYRGRSGLYEILLLDDEIRNMILAKVDSGRIKALAIEKGMMTLREDGARRVAAGLTTTEEVLRVTQEDKV
ncbi:MAG: type II secretion system ATPase GspE [Nitrospiria bacterium]